MTYFLYNLLLFLVSPFYILRVLWKNGGWRERFGNISLPTKSGKIIWLHAVSVGEVVASKPLISLINKELPDYEVVLSTVTKTGREMAQKLTKKKGDSDLFLKDKKTGSGLARQRRTGIPPTFLRK